MNRNINKDEVKDTNIEKEMGKNVPEESGKVKNPLSEEKERSIVARLKRFPKSRKKSAMERSRKIAAIRLTQNAYQELHWYESHNPERDFNEERFLHDTVWRHEELRLAKDDDYLSDYLILPDWDKAI